ncbi:MAG: class I SAM-dependent methyltransferase, partial [Nocardioidaceae bacterium]
MEVAPGYGRWTAEIVGKTRTLTLVDLSPTCLEVCKAKFDGVEGLTFIETDGTCLPGVADSSIDFIWSFDSFV